MVPGGPGNLVRSGGPSPTDHRTRLPPLAHRERRTVETSRPWKQQPLEHEPTRPGLLYRCAHFHGDGGHSPSRPRRPAYTSGACLSGRRAPTTPPAPDAEAHPGAHRDDEGHAGEHGALPPGRRGRHPYHRDGGELLSHRTAWVGSASFKAVIAAPGVLGHGHRGHKATRGVCLNLPHDGRPRLEGNGNPGPGAKPFSP